MITPMQFLTNYIVPVASGVFLLIFISIFGFVIHKMLKMTGVYGMIKNLGMSFNKKKLLADDALIEYCVQRVEKDWTEPQVREELLLANSYSKQRIDQVIYVFNVIKKELKGDTPKKKADLPSTERSVKK